MVAASRWSAKPLSKDATRPIQGNVCATIWTTCSLGSTERWFDELYLWTEGFDASAGQRVRMQAFALKQAFYTLGRGESKTIAVTLSFGTVERALDHFAGALEANSEHSQRLVVMLRGAYDRLKHRYRLRAFVEYLRILKVPVGYRLSSPRVSMELKALDFLRPDFAKVLAPRSSRLEAWQDMMLEARVAEVPVDRLIVAGLETEEQLGLARQLGIPFGQGSAIMAARAPSRYTRLEAALQRSRPPKGAPPARSAAAPDARLSKADGRPVWSELARLWDIPDRGTVDDFVAGAMRER